MARPKWRPALPPVPVLPEKIMLKATLFGHGANGYALHVGENQKLGITCISTREAHGEPWKREYSITCLPDQVFHSATDLREAIELLT